MGESERYLDRKIRKMSLGDDNNALMALIAINAMIFVCFGLIQVIYQVSQSSVVAFQYEILRWAVLPGKLSTLAIEPWTVLTFMFVHTGVIYTIVNLLWLWAFGSILQNVAGNNRVIPLYLYGGFAGAVFFIAAAYSFPALKNQVEYLSLFGSNASILAIAIAVTTLVPKYKLFPMLNGGIPLWVLTLIYVFIDAASTAQHTAHLFAHLGGAICGFFFIFSYKRGSDWGLWMTEFYKWFINLFEPGRKTKMAASVRKTLFYKTGNRTPFIKQPVVTQERIDRILDKINQQGFDHLTEEEKGILKKASEEEF